MSDGDFVRREPIIGDRGAPPEPATLPPGEARPEDSPAVRSAGGGIGALWKILVVISLLGTIAISGFAWQQSLALAELLARFDELSAKINSTDQSLNQSGAAIAVKLNAQGAELDKHWAEIKKLWVLGNETNRKALTANKSSLDNLKNNLDDQKTSLDNLAKTVKQLDQATAALKTSFDVELKKIDTASSSALAASAHVDDISGRVKAMSEKLNFLDKSVRESQASLSARVTENEQAIRSIDTFRRQMTQQMQEIRQRQVGSGQ